MREDASAPRDVDSDEARREGSRGVGPDFSRDGHARPYDHLDTLM
jgi:hypothetical protein